MPAGQEGELHTYAQRARIPSSWLRMQAYRKIVSLNYALSDSEAIW